MPTQCWSQLFWSRLWRHLLLTRWQLRRWFPERSLQQITEAVQRSELQHGGEIRVVIEGDWPLAALWSGLTTRQRAKQIFGAQGLWDTEYRNAVLVYLAMADQQVEIFADRGLAQVDLAVWQDICQQLEQGCAHGRFAEAVAAAVTQIGTQIARHFPHADRNEMPDRPLLL